jgi:hypothetical protein
VTTMGFFVSNCHFGTSPSSQENTPLFVVGVFRAIFFSGRFFPAQIAQPVHKLDLTCPDHMYTNRARAAGGRRLSEGRMRLSIESAINPAQCISSKRML